jgi:hypothetical protein
MVFLAALLMSAVAFGVLAHPLLRPRRPGSTKDRVDGRQREELLSQRDAAYAAIKELDFEYQLGNLSEQDYEDLRARYRDRAVGVLRQLDALGREEAAARRPGGRRPQPDGGALDEIEQAVALLRQKREGREPSLATVRPDRAADVTCPTCHGPVSLEDRYCGNCGTDQLRFCPACAAPREPAQRFCAHCGERLAQA